jgi:putative DNA primase/helicase
MDDSLALDFTKRHAADWQYVAAWEDSQWTAPLANETTLRAYDPPALGAASSRCDRLKDCRKGCERSHGRGGGTSCQADRNTRPQRINGMKAREILNTRRALMNQNTRTDETCEALHNKLPSLPGDNCPTWLSFLNEITDGDEELQPIWLGRDIV